MTFFDDAFAGCPIMAILRGQDPATTVTLCTAAWDLGITLVEVALSTPDAVPALRAALSAAAERDRTVGAGTVLYADQVTEIARLGGRFIVSPGFDPEISTAAAAAGLAHLPGVATATDVTLARKHGLAWQKAFPASVLGVDWVKALRAPFPDVNFVATGGINADNAREYLSAGYRAVAVGSALQDPRQLELLAQLIDRS